MTRLRASSITSGAATAEATEVFFRSWTAKFVSAGETARRLRIDRTTLDQWVRDGRIKAYRGVGRDSFFKATEVETLYKELHPEAALAQAVAEDERDSAAAGTAQPMQLTVRKKQDPQMRVYLRLQADAKWYDTSEEDIRTWFQQLAPDGYERNKKNADHTIKKLQYLVGLIEEAQKKRALLDSRVIEDLIVEQGWIIALDKQNLAGPFEQRIDFDPRTIDQLEIKQVV